jgi:uncharacterized protein (TIGR02186 family)
LIRFVQITLLLAAFLAASAARAGALVSDISAHQIEVRYSFNSSDLLLFGAISQPGAAEEADDFDIVIVVRGPDSQVIVRRKDNVAGIWMNNASLVYKNVPGYYAIAQSRPLDEIADAETLAAIAVGFDNIPLDADREIEVGEKSGFRAGLIRNKTRLGLYQDRSAYLSIKENTLFRTEFHFPSNVPVGDYDARVYLFQDGELVAEQRSPLNIIKGGFSQGVYNLAHQNAALYGLLAIFLALSAGWLAGVVARKHN